MRANRAFPFLEFLVNGALEGKEFTEEEIAVKVFQVPDDWAPILDARVRVGRRNLRRYLAEYYATEGAGDVVLIEVPYGRGYRALYSWNPDALDRTTRHEEIAELAKMLSRLWPTFDSSKSAKEFEDFIARTVRLLGDQSERETRTDVLPLNVD